MKWLGILRVPQEKNNKAEIITKFEECLNEQDVKECFSLKELLNDKTLFEVHMAQLHEEEMTPENFRPEKVTAEWKINHAENIEHLEKMLNVSESMTLLSSASLLILLKGRIG